MPADQYDALSYALKCISDTQRTESFAEFLARLAREQQKKQPTHSQPEKMQ